MSDQRGLVVSCPIEVSGNQVSIRSTQLDPQELRFALLFWDKLDFPSNNLLHIGLSGDDQFLCDAGVLSRSHVQMVGSFSGVKPFLDAHLLAFRQLDAQQPGAWSLSRGEKSIAIPEHELEVGRGVLVSLHRAIPVPDKDVPIQDILEFRSKRRAELLALRHYLERIYQRIVSAGDGPLALKSEIEQLEISIADHVAAMKSSGLRSIRTNLSANINFLQGVQTAATALALRVPLLESLIAGAAASLSINASAALKGSSATGTPFQYITSMHRDLF